MRALAALPLALLAGCSSTTFAEPRVLVSPYLAVYQLRGDVALQAFAAGPAFPVDRTPQSMRTFGQDHHREDIGVRADIGDGFAGVRFDYYKLEMGTSRVGTLTDDWGALLAGDQVRMQAEMDELRIGYLESLGTLRTTWREQPLTVRFAGGGVFSHRDLALRARTDDGSRSQNVAIDGDSLFVAARCRAAWRDWTLDAEYAASPDLVLGGDFKGYQQDLELRLAYTMALHDVTFFGGYRLSTFEADGHAGRLAYDADLTIDGFQLGISLTF